MRSKRKDVSRYLGERRVNQEIVKFIEYRQRSKKGEYPIYEVLCHNCENRYESFYYNFADKRKTGKVCQKCSNKECRDYSLLTVGEYQVSMVYSNYKSKCKMKNWIFDLSKKQFDTLVKSNCHYCGQAPNKFRPDRAKNKRVQDSSFLLNGIDRKNNDLGYTIENSLPCCEDCNKAKRQLDYEVFLKLIESIHKNLIEKRD